MAVDTDQAIITAIYTILVGDITGDDSLKGIMGTIRLYPDMAEENAPMPYGVHSFESSPGDTLSLRNGVYKLDWWDFATTKTRILQMRYRTIVLLDEKRLQPPDGEFGAARIVLDRGEPMETDADDVWRYHLRFDVTYERVREILAVIARG